MAGFVPIGDTAKTVEGLGIHSVRVEDPDEVAPALKRDISDSR